MATKYLQYFPKPLLDDLVAGRWLPIIGAGLSRNAVVPPSKRIPPWAELGDALRSELGDRSPPSPIDTISAYAHEYGRPKLIERLSELLLVDEARPGDTHSAFCAIPFDRVCTTNFDLLLERQYNLIARHCTPLIGEDQLSVNLKDAGVALLKLHGDLHHPNHLVATQDDYDRFSERFPLWAAFLTTVLMTRTVVFIGYSLDDPDFRQVWHNIGDRLGQMRRAAYSIMVAPEHSDVARFELHDVKVIELPGSKGRYGQVLADVFTELHKHWQESVISGRRGREHRSDPVRGVAATAQSVSVRDGNIYFHSPPEIESRQLTSTGLDSQPCVSPDGKLVVFVRSTPGQTVEVGVGDWEATEIWIVRVDGTEARMLVRGGGGPSLEKTLAGFGAPQFSPDGRRIWFLSMAWVTSRAVHELDLEMGGVRFVCPGNSLEVVPRGEYAGHLMVSQHRYFLGGGSYDWLYLVTPDGREVGPIAEEQFRQLFIPEPEGPMVGSE